PSSVVGQNKPAPVTSPNYKINESNTVIATPGSTEIVSVAVEQANRIVVDGLERVGVQMSSSSASVEVDRNVIAISTNDMQPISMFVYDADNPDARAISLTIIPKRIPGKEIVLKTNSGALALNLNGTSKADKWEKSSPYLSVLNKLIKGIASGTLPDGYQIVSLPMGNLPVCRQSGIKFDFEKTAQTVVGGNLVAHIGTAKNITSGPIEFVEDSCGEYGVLAVSSYPSPVIDPGKRIEVYVVKDKAKKPQASKFRASLVE
ncbi:MAG: hypothetical protein EOP48_22000, partial [Sphingobacteriales bacterium]